MTTVTAAALEVAVEAVAATEAAAMEAILEAEAARAARQLR
jgi:hypothetical protein